ncbi:MAG: hypothetical protein A3B70_06765 [Deltaproteobacteria bacterium RIFCSPHIGHO2_02_FULL_40_11]|nr:MAG: hypothetical protein A3B70_06765 [Deltaproteobacteria bacterium RIFCSPHIGHO2_02_FULL_40_11]
MLLFDKIKRIAPITSSQNISFLRKLYFNPPHPKMQGSLIGFIRRVQGMEGFELLQDVYIAESQKENGSLEVLRVLLEDIFTMTETQDEAFKEKMALFLLSQLSHETPAMISRYLAILKYKPAIPILQEIVNSPETDTREKIYVQMDLAYLGDQTFFSKIVQDTLQGNYNVIIAERIANAELIDLIDPILMQVFTEFSKNGCTKKFTTGLATIEIIIKKTSNSDMVGKILNFYTKIFRHCFDCETEQWIMLRSMVLMQIDDYEKEVADFMWNLLSTDRFSRISIRLKLIPFLLIQKKVWGLRMVILLLAHADPKIQKEAERALKQRKAEEVLPHLQELVKNTQDPILAFKAAQLVTYFTGKKSPMKLRK